MDFVLSAGVYAITDGGGLSVGTSGQDFDQWRDSFMTPGVPNPLGIAMDITGETCHEEDSIPYMLYNIQGKISFTMTNMKEKKYEGEEFAVVKGYADFVNLHRVLWAKKSAMGMPSLPDVTLFSDWEEDNLKKVTKGLIDYLLLVSVVPILHHSPEFKQFLATGPLPAKEQVEILTKLNPLIKYINPATHVQDASIDITKEFEVPDFLFFKHKEYIIRGRDQRGEFTISRNYKDFVLIREILVEKFPGIPFAYLPKADTPGTVPGLSTFLKRINRMPEVYFSEEYQVFIRYPERDLQEKLKSFKKSKSILATLF